MSLVLIVASLGLLCLPRCARRLGWRLPPAEWARVAASGLVAGSIALEVALVLLAAPTVLRVLGAPALASACSRVFGELAPGGVYVGWSAFLVALMFPVLALRAALRSRRRYREMWIEPWLGAHLESPDAELVVLPSAQPIAYSVARGQGQVVVSDGLVDALEASELEAVLRHELAHLRWGHQRYLGMATALEGAVPILQFSTLPLRTALERWADEEAAGASLPQRVCGRNALLAMTAAVLAPASEVAAFGSPATVVERVDALERPPVTPDRARRLLVYGVVGGLGLLGALAVSQWISHAHMMLTMAGYCPS